MRKFLPNTKVKIFDRNLNPTDVEATIVNRIGEKEVLVQFNLEDEELFNIGTMPIPPYIRGGKADDKDIVDYQSIFAQQDGSVAAPTASLHFSSDLISKMKTAGALIEQVTLHVGSASFLPLWTPEDESSDNIQIKSPGIELYKYDLELLNRLISAKNEGRRVIAVGTTVVRALESMIRHSRSSSESNLLETDLFIQPGFEFKLCSNLVTNFHQPRTTHLMLVSAFCSEDKIKNIYQHALNDKEYRFLSYGDGMFII
jgi:S-adenosylmethionine:tRNA ribosyltransferase-isomerase